ncbi:MAG: prepilin-type N-terminal cleavage/methylation domain-containing protein [Planctomycetota bacterium]
MTRPRGFTLIELVTSLAITSIVVGAIGSSIMLASRTLPDSSRETDRLLAMQRALGTIAADLRYATAVRMIDGTTIEMVVRDRDQDSSAEMIVYSWNGDAGDPLTRTVNSGDNAAILSSLATLSFGWSEKVGVAEPSHRAVEIDLAVGGMSSSLLQRCLNLEAD